MNASLRRAALRAAKVLDRHTTHDDSLLSAVEASYANGTDDELALAVLSVVHAAESQAVGLPDPGVGLTQALRIYVEDAGTCDEPGCSDGAGPVCDPSELGCQLRRLMLRPGEVHELIAAEHAWSGID